MAGWSVLFVILCSYSPASHGFTIKISEDLPTDNCKETLSNLEVSSLFSSHPQPAEYLAVFSSVWVVFISSGNSDTILHVCGCYAPCDLWVNTTAYLEAILRNNPRDIQRNKS